jgi:hypothetical protein
VRHVVRGASDRAVCRKPPLLPHPLGGIIGRPNRHYEGKSFLLIVCRRRLSKEVLSGRVAPLETKRLAFLIGRLNQGPLYKPGEKSSFPLNVISPSLIVAVWASRTSFSLSGSRGG